MVTVTGSQRPISERRFLTSGFWSLASSLRLLHSILWFLNSGLWLLVPVAFAANTLPAARSLLLDATTVGSTIIAVGERGAIIRSTDSGQSWELLSSPTRATLTGISFADNNRGWIVGHDGIILATRDGGLTWTQQFNNTALSFLDVLALDPRHAIAIGAFGSFFTTDDGGTSWTQRKALEEDLHLNRLTASVDGTLFIAGERGTLLRTTRNLETFTAAPTGYEGSFFGVLPLGNNAVLAYGLRGHVFRSEDAEISWQPIALETPALIMTAVKLKTSTIILAGQARVFFVSNDDGRNFHAWQPGLTTAVAELLEAPDGSLLAFGEAGVTRLPKPE